MARSRIVGQFGKAVLEAGKAAGETISASATKAQTVNTTTKVAAEIPKAPHNPLEIFVPRPQQHQGTTNPLNQIQTRQYTNPGFNPTIRTTHTPPVGLALTATLAANSRQPLFQQPASASFSTSATKIIKPEKPLDYRDFDITGKVTKLEDAGKHAVYIAKHKGKTYFLKDIVDSAEYNEAYIKASEDGRPTDGIYPTLEEQKFRVEKEIFATRLMNLVLGDKHTPPSIYPVVARKPDGSIKSYYIASESVGNYKNIMTTGFFVGPDNKTRIKFNDKDYLTTGRIAIKIAQHLTREKDGNLQNIGVGIGDPEPIAVKSIDHEHAFERPVGNIEYEVDNLVNGPIYSPFGDKMNLAKQAIASREKIRTEYVKKISDLLNEGTQISNLFQTSFSHDHNPLYRNKITAIREDLQKMKIIYNKANDILQSRNKKEGLLSNIASTAKKGIAL